MISASSKLSDVPSAEQRPMDSRPRAVEAGVGAAASHYSTASLLEHDGEVENAMIEYRACLEIDPVHADALWHYGVLLQQRDFFRAAMGVFERLLSIEGAVRPRLLGRMGACAARLPGREQSAENFFQDQLAVESDPQTHADYCNFLLAQGRLEEAWYHYSRRTDVDPASMTLRAGFPYRPWGGDLHSVHTLVVHGETQSEDELVLAGYLPELMRRAGRIGCRVILAVRPALRRLFAASFPDAVVVGHSVEQPADLDYQIAGSVVNKVAMSELPRFLPRPGAGAYLVPHADDLQRMRDYVDHVLTGTKKMPVGLYWLQGRSAESPSIDNSIPLMLLNDLAGGCDKLRFFGLTEPEDRAILAQVPDLDLVDASFLLSDYSRRAALMLCLRAVVTNCTFTANLAGGLGVDVRLCLPRQAEWYWSARTAWYPCANVYRQQISGDWLIPVRRMVEELVNAAAGEVPQAEAG